MLAKFHGNILNLSENMAKFLGRLLIFDSHCMLTTLTHYQYISELCEIHYYAPQEKEATRNAYSLCDCLFVCLSLSVYFLFLVH